MKLHFLPGQRFECSGCARCCGAPWRIHVDPRCRGVVEGTLLELRVIEEVQGPAFVEEDDGVVVTARREGRCAFLDERRLCSIHARFGRENKPHGCRQFPLMIRPTPDGVVVGVSFFCPSVQKNQGRPLEEYADEVRDLISHMRYQPAGEEPIPVAGEVCLDWPGYRDLEGFLLTRLEGGNPGRTLGRALMEVCRWVRERGDLGRRLREPGGPDPVIASLAGFFTAVLVGMLEVEEADQARPFTEALMAGGRVRVRRFDWEGEASRVADYAERARPGWIDPEITRYLKALVFRKFLVGDRPLLERLSCLYLLPPLLRWYTCASGVARGVEAPEPEDLFRAFDVAERELITHARGLDRLFEGFAEAFLKTAG